MKVNLRDYLDNWQNIKNATMTTISKDMGKMPDSEWKRKLLLSEHSPIRKLKISWKWYDLMYWVSVHFVRHKIGIEHWVSTQRTDRTNINRNEKPQGAFVDHEAEANAQAIITISRKRLCKCASKETQEAWKKVLDEIEKVEPELRSCCVPDCVYRNGLCVEFFSCSYNKTPKFEEELKNYIKGIENQVNDKTNINLR